MQSFSGARRGLRRTALVVALAAFALAGTAASSGADRMARTASADTDGMVERGDRGPDVREIQAALGIAADGIFGPQTERGVKRFQRRRGLLVDGVVGPQTRAALGLPATTSGAGRRSVRMPRILLRIAECESGGNPRVVSPGGTYRGKYQFTRATWRALGGRGDPAKAPEWQQDRMALKLYRRSGVSPWPSCS